MIRGRLWAADLTDRSAAAPVAGFVEVKADRLSAISAAMAGDGERAAGRLARGCRCFAIQERGEIVAYGWLSTAPEWIGELSTEISPADHEAYVWNCVTLPGHRRHGHYRDLLAGIMAQARLEGLARLWIGSVDDPAEKANADVGFVAVIDVSVRRFAGFRWARIRSNAAAAPALVDAALRRMNHRWWAAVRPVRLHQH